MKLVTVICIFLWGSFAFAQQNHESPRLLVHLLDYLAKDYGGAVSEGKVISASEYNEQMEFAATAVTTGNRIPEVVSSHELKTGLSELHSLISKKAPASDVSSLAKALQAKIIVATNLKTFPKSWPDLSSGAKLFAENCSACHGESGAGDGPAGVNLDPKPANFLDREAMSALSPFQAYNTIRMGVQGTGMPPFPNVSESQVWDLSFYLVSLRYKKADGDSPQNSPKPNHDQNLLEQVATLSDHALSEKLSLSESERAATLGKLRLTSSEDFAVSGESSINVDSLEKALSFLDDAEAKFKNGEIDSARTAALRAYLEGIEPVEPRLRANAPETVVSLERVMADLRSAIENKASPEDVSQRVAAARNQIIQAKELLSEKPSSPLFLSFIAGSILFREGFEAALIIIALLGVVRATGSHKAGMWLHGGWVTAVALGFVGWFFSGWVISLSGAQREMMEGVISLIAVVILLYLGFWLHSKTSIHKWKQFIDGQVKTALDGGSRWGLAAISFMAVFREAFESILFLRAVALEDQVNGMKAIGVGVGVGFVCVFIISWMLVRFSAKIPVRKLFTLSSVVMSALSVILVGKGIHAFQETGDLSSTPAPVSVRLDLVGIYPTSESLAAQIALVFIIVLLWKLTQTASPTAKIKAIN